MDEYIASAKAHWEQFSIHFAKFVFVRDYEQMRVAHANAVRCRTIGMAYIEHPGE